MWSQINYLSYQILMVIKNWLVLNGSLLCSLQPVVPQSVKKFPEFIDPKGSLPHSQHHVTCQYHQPDQPSQIFPHLFKIYFNYIFLSTPRSSKWSLSIRFLHQTLYAFLFSVIHTTYPIHLHVLGLIAQIIFHKEIKSRRPLLYSFSLDSLVSIKFSWHRWHVVLYMQKKCMTKTIFLNLLCCLPWLYFTDNTRHQRVHIVEWEGDFPT